MSVTRPIIYGNTLTPIGAIRPPGINPDHTHHWTVFVRDPNGNDISYMIKKVVFKLHDTYVNLTRSIEEPPFEVTETGWGEFEINIKIFFKSESGEKNLSIFHHLRLHPYQNDANKEEGLLNNGKNVESILYDEVVFNEPTDKMFEILTLVPRTLLPIKSTKSNLFSRQLELDELDRLNIATNKVLKELETERDKLKALEAEKTELTSAE